jgi:hypothetical protein
VGADAYVFEQSKQQVARKLEQLRVYYRLFSLRRFHLPPSAILDPHRRNDDPSHQQPQPQPQPQLRLAHD